MTSHKKTHKSTDLKKVDSSFIFYSKNTARSYTYKDNLSVMSTVNFAYNIRLEDDESSQQNLELYMKKSSTEKHSVHENNFCNNCISSSYKPNCYHNFNVTNINSIFNENMETLNNSDYPDLKIVEYDKDYLGTDIYFCD